MPTPLTPSSTGAIAQALNRGGDAGRQALRELLHAGQAEILDAFRSGASPEALVAARSQQIDLILRGLWERELGPLAQSWSLVAVGGYGRAELLPGSDVDLMILVPGSLPESLPAAQQTALEGFLALLWDIGLEVGQSLRSIEDCVREAAADITVITNLTEARHLAGSTALFEAMVEATGPEHIWPAAEFFAGKREEQRRRHARYHDTGYNLEPNVKESPGGLRDIQMISWVARRHFGTGQLRGLLDHGFLTTSEFEALCQGRNFLWRVRYALHTLTRRREDRLLFDHQRALAGMLGYEGDGNSLAVEQFMRDYYRRVFELSRLNEMLLQLFDETFLDPSAVDATPQPLNRRFQARHGFLEVSDPGVFRYRPAALLEAFLLLAQHPELKGVRASTIRLMRDHRHLIDDSFRADLGVRSLFMEILRQPRGVTHELRRMNRYGILASYLPVFGRIVGQMQYDLFHTYTVDEHTLFVVRNLRRLMVPEFNDELPGLSAIAQRIPKPELLLIAGLFHDIAKGRGGDHSQLGAVDALTFCRDHKLPEWDAGLVAWLVENHLLMSSTAQHRDISDPAVINEFAGRMQTPLRLNYLYLLTVADIRATNPTLWNSWKAALLDELYQATLDALRRGLEHPQGPTEQIRSTREQAQQLLLHEVEDAVREPLWQTLPDDYFLRQSAEEIAWHTQMITRQPGRRAVIELRQSERGGTELLIYADADDRVFAITTAVVDQFGLDIADARIFSTTDGHGLHTYVLLDADGRAIADAYLSDRLLEQLRGHLDQPVPSTPKVTRGQPRLFRHFKVPTEVRFSNDEANHRTILELTTGDRPGLLCAVGRVLRDQQVRLHSARIATFGARAEDVFYLSDAGNQALSEGAVREVLRQRLLDALNDETGVCG